jgi:branched-chain amino acid transport system substrate-binding protein
MRTPAHIPRKIAFFIIIVILSCITVLRFAAFNPFQEKIEIAYVSTLTNLDETKLQSGKNNIDAINLYLNSINDAGGINGKKVFLSIYDDQGSPAIALEVAEQVARSNAIAVIGHRTSQLTLAGSKAYQEYSMPVINPENTADELTKFKWFFRTTFSNQIQSVLLANYANKVLKYSKATVIRGDDVYGENLGGQAASNFKKLGGELVSELVVGKNFVEDSTRIIETLKASIKEEKDPGLLLVAMSYDRAVEFIRQLKQSRLNLTILGGNTLSDFAIAQQFKETPEAQQDQDFYTRDILAFTPIIFDMLDDSGQKFKTLFEKTYKRDLNWQAIAAHDASVGVIEALKKSNIAGKNTSEIRSLVIKGLREFDSPTNAFNGAGRSIYFDASGDAVTPAYVSLFDRQQLVSAFTQLDLVKDPNRVNDLPAKIKSGDILQVSDRYLQKVNIVYVGMDLNSVNNIDESKSSYILDFYLWFRYQGSIPIDQIEFTNHSGTSDTKLSLGKPIEEGSQDKINYKIYRVQGEFSEIFNFKRYPFDQQVLKMKFRHENMNRNQLIYVVDLVGMRGAKSDKTIEKAKRTGAFDNVSSWIFNKIDFFQSTNIENSTFGHRYLIDTDSDIRYSQFTSSIEATRDVRSFAIKNLLPLLFFMIISYLLMFLPFDAISIEAVSGLLLAVVFYHLSLTDKLPKSIGYTVLLDYAFYAVYFLLGLQLLIIVLGNSDKISDHGISRTQLMVWGRVAIPTIITGLTILIFSVVV